VRVLVWFNEMRSWGQSAETGNIFCDGLAIRVMFRLQHLRAIDRYRSMPYVTGMLA
jgi:hypothetical protein